MDKPTLRKIFLEERNKIEPRLHKMLNHMLMAALRDVLAEYELEKIGIYYPLGNEIDVRGLSDTYEVYYPKTFKEEIVFYKDTGKFETGQLGIKEPKDSKPVDKNVLDAVIVPGLVYDDALYRLGYGKGYYDDFLKDFQGLKVGVVFEKFRVEALPNKPHDIPVDILVSDNLVYESRHGEDD